jgi:hypothetical protein
MIELLGDDFSIKIKPENPLYNTMKRFSGETVLITLIPNINREKNEKKTPKVFDTIDRDVVFNDFFNAFFWSNLPEKEQPLVYVMLKNHLYQILGSDKGKKSLEKIENNIYKVEELYLVLNNPA